MPNEYCGRTNNHVGKVPARLRPQPEKLQSLTFEQLAYRMCSTFGTAAGEAARHALMERMGLEPAKGNVEVEL